MGARPTAITLTPEQGGQLDTAQSLGGVGPYNYVEKVNFRRKDEKEIRREGWVLYRPNTGIAQGSQATPGGSIIAIAECVRPNQTRAIFAASRTTVYKYDYTTGTWSTVNAGLSALGKRWQIIPLNGSLLWNNGVDLPFTTRVEDELIPVNVSNPGFETAGAGGADVFANWTESTSGTSTIVRDTAVFDTGLASCKLLVDASASSVGVSQTLPLTVGRRYRLTFRAKISTAGQVRVNDGLTDLLLQTLTASFATYTLDFTAAAALLKLYSVTASQNVWVDNVVVVDITGSYPVYELRENGIASVGFIEELNGIIQCYDVTEITAANLNAVMTGAAPYGLVDPTLCNRIQFRCIWGEIGLPRNWAPIFSLSQPASSVNITLPFPSSIFVAGVTRVAVVNGGPSGGVLGGDTAHPDGILVTAVAGAVITLEVATDAGLSYPRTVQVTRWADQSTIAGRYDLQDDASEIVWVKKLGWRMIIYRKSSIFRSVYLGNVDQPFEFRRVCGTNNVPVWGEAVAEVNGEYHLYPGEGNKFFMFDATNEPSIHKVTNAARSLLFSGLTPASDVYAVANPVTNEIWFVRPGSVFCFDLDKNTVSTIDADINAACYIRRPSSSDRWFVLGIGTSLFTYGLVESATNPLQTFLRNGVAAGGRIKGGLTHWNDRYNEKDMSSYVIELGSGTAAAALQLKLYSTYAERVAPALLLTENMTGPTYLVPVLYRAIFFQDEINITETGDIDIQVTARIFDRAPVRTQSTPRKTNV